MGSPIARLHLTLNHLKGHNQGHPDFKALYLIMEPS